VSHSCDLTHYSIESEDVHARRLSDNSAGVTSRYWELDNDRRNKMSFRSIAIVTFICTWQATSAQSGKDNQQMNHDESSHAAGQSQTKPHTRTRAKAKITVQSSEATPYDQTASPKLMELRLSETFTGDIEGESPVRALQVLRDDHSASLVSVQRFRGKLGGRQGTFVLQGQEVVENGKIKATWFVVPGSGTGDLSGLRGEGGFEGEFGKGSDGTLDYWFE
jgi:hypothetical protein